MRILILASLNSYGSNEEELIAAMLEKELKEKGHNADTVLLPYDPDALTTLEQMLAYSMIDLSAAETVITVGYPACMAKHPNKTVYLLETSPMLHEYWDTEYGISGNYQYSQILIRINSAEQKTFNEAKAVFCASELLCGDLQRRYGFSAKRLPLPALAPSDISRDKPAAGEYYITETCLLQNSRFTDFMDLMKEGAGAHVCFFVPNADRVYLQALKNKAAALGKGAEAEIFSGYPSDEVIEGSAGYLHFPYQSRRPDNILKRCAAKGIRIIAAKDSGYAAELAADYGNIGLVDFDKMLRAGAAGKNNAEPLRERITASEFADMVAGI